MSGYNSNDINGKIVCETNFMTPEALNRTSNGVLGWSDVRFLDNAFRTQTITTSDSNLTYLRNKNIRKNSGMHLFAILTGKRIFHTIEHVKEIKGLHIPSPIKPQLKIAYDNGTMIFPNPQTSDDHGLYFLQSYSDYAGLVNNFIAHQELSTTNTTPGRFPMTDAQAINSYKKIVMNQSNLCIQDKRDIFAICLLQAWAIRSKIGQEPLNFLSNPGYMYFFTSFDNQKGQIQSLLKFPCNYKALETAGTILTGFAEQFQTSPSYGNSSYSTDLD